MSWGDMKNPLKESTEKEVLGMEQCTLCNEAFEQIEIEFGEIIEVDEEFWHAECYAEYFGEVLETA